MARLLGLNQPLFVYHSGPGRKGHTPWVSGGEFSTTLEVTGYCLVNRWCGLGASLASRVLQNGDTKRVFKAEVGTVVSYRAEVPQWFCGVIHGSARTEKNWPWPVSAC